MNTKAEPPVIVWFRKDLRLGDNHALSAACQSGRPVLAVHIREAPESGNGPLGAAQRWWLHHSLNSLETALSTHGGRLILRSGRADKVIDALIAESGANSVYWNRRYDPAGIAFDTALKNNLAERGLSARSFSGQLLHEPSRLKTGGGTPYRVFTPFWRALEGNGEPASPLPVPEMIPVSDGDFPSECLDDWKLLPSRPDWAAAFADQWTPGEAAAQEKLAEFTEERLAGYGQARDLPGRDGTSLLSPHLALGEITPGQIWHATQGLKDVPASDVITFRKELAWRDFSYHLLFHNPHLSSVNIHRKYDDLRWRDDDDGFQRWTRGETGYPIVDAGMRQLWRHGYMHNRVRMVAASFLIKDLLIDWRRGEQWFRDTLVDADPASNAASWQWVAGSGADASPFFRIFNPVLQGEKFDSAGDYVRRFVPELAALPDKFIHRPFDAPAHVLENAGVVLGKTYPKPVVEHAMARDRALAALNALSHD
ncbi:MULTISPECIES: deoxyribodipyrimidine photo-lyase [unclassified Rhizobium]|uniref:cryptochrome/photolyase family protein n=1 Tax=unclassified Rhizobium TaxID=2613769 RepID=UPI000701DFC2|nr:MULTISPECIES: deoxyribodipyrimidine photo-lyase [unclassified Rhizobium]KQV34327.1 deoxyribodipyrimidine photolyase [Rhizobium sp. Root1212]KRD23705.1 deoxyribodipyrimidine photolyase [Rhizobium sp. Root268]